VTSAGDTAAQVRAGTLTATRAVEASLGAIKAGGSSVNAFTCALEDRARAHAHEVDQAIAAGRPGGPLAGVPFAVKNLFDVEGVTTLAGSVIEAAKPPAAANAAAVERLVQAGAVLVGTTNMDEYAYGFTTENTHYGATRNPHDPERVAGGSSGGSAAAVAAGMAPLALGSDTNGSVRVPAALCGVFGLRPTFGRISRRGTTPFTPSLDAVGIFSSCVSDLAIAFDVLQGPDRQDPVCSPRPAEPVVPALSQGAEHLRVAVAGGYFGQGGMPEAYAAVERAARLIGASETVVFAEAAAARAAAMVISSVEGARVHLSDLRARAADFDPMTRYRFLAGALVPATAYVQAQQFRRWFADEVRKVFARVDVVLAPATPFAAPLVGQREATVPGTGTVLTQPYLGVYTQPLSLVGLPVVVVPICQPGQMPLGVQVVAAPFNERAAFQVAAALERGGCTARVRTGA
jgi:AtzE family amidohydrolase